MLTLKKIVIGSAIFSVLSISSAIAQPLITVSQSRPVFRFSTPSFERYALFTDLNTAEAWKRVAHNAFIAHDYLNSIAAYGKAIDLAALRDRSELLEERGWVHYRLEQFERADEDFRQAASLHRQQREWEHYNNVRQMRRFVQYQAHRANSSG